MNEAKCEFYPDNAGELIGLKFSMPNVTGIMDNKTSRVFVTYLSQER